MNKFTAQAVTEYGIGGSVNGMGKREKLEGAYVINPQGRRVRAFRNNEGGLAAAEKWAEFCNENFL
jgi:hypothetical protein